MIESQENMSPRILSTPFLNQGVVNGIYTIFPNIPQPIDMISNTLITDVLSINFVKTVSQPTAIIGNTLSYALKIINNSTIDITNLLVKDTDISPFLTISNVKLNDAPIPKTEDLINGISIKALKPVETATITFDALILDDAPSLLSNIATMTYDYGKKSGKQDSNKVDVSLLKASMSILKSADKSVVTKNGETLEYTLKITNTGNVLLYSLVLLDIIPAGMTYIPFSTIIGSNPPVDATPETGISIPNLDIAETTTVRFSVIVSI